ncbi:MAG TPA: lysophospholipid acyltransferase family protein [Candidatus Acidoferrales bacterium]|nr:lysophospholipid acyltransferase family protein [Candidatus Acidoferrales bacterium]
MFVASPLRPAMLYSWWCWLCFTAVVIVFAPFILILPGLRMRQRAARRAIRIAWTLCGLRPTVTGLEHLPANATIIVANHASYLDGLLLTGVLPAGYVFVVKREMSQVPLAGRLLGRLGTAFVTRQDAAAAALDARAIMRRGRNGTSFVFFPEGTIPPQERLGPFRLGAFLTAAELGYPVVPVTLLGTAKVLPDNGSWVVSRYRLSVHIHAPIQPAGRQRGDLARLRDASRGCIEAGLSGGSQPDGAT